MKKLAASRHAVGSNLAQALAAKMTGSTAIGIFKAWLLSAASRLPTSGQRVHVGPSQIDGLGLFAAEEFDAGATLCEYIGQKVPRSFIQEHSFDSSYILPTGECLDARCLGNEGYFVNHSCLPNAQAVTENERIYFKSARKIASMEEITIDYRVGLDTELGMICNCGALPAAHSI